ncbi:hypothetical protein BD779DRAFT_1807569 [Infundibulicybe gibba]|nr:hypothetical protein BD779DRAFT_1807569 [Infundibulicybe gibba]
MHNSTLLVSACPHPTPLSLGRYSSMPASDTTASNTIASLIHIVANGFTTLMSPIAAVYPRTGSISIPMCCTDDNRERQGWAHAPWISENAYWGASWGIKKTKTIMMLAHGQFGQTTPAETCRLVDNPTLQAPSTTQKLRVRRSTGKGEGEGDINEDCPGTEHGSSAKTPTIDVIPGTI